MQRTPRKYRKLTYYLNRLESTDNGAAGLKKFLLSPLFGKHASLVEVLSAYQTVMEAYSHSLEQTAPDIQTKIHTILHGDQPINGKGKKYLDFQIHRLLDKVLEYYAFCGFREVWREMGLRPVLMLREMKKRGAGRYLHTFFTKEKTRHFQFLNSSGHYRNQLDLKVEYNDFLSTNSNPRADTHLNEVLESLDAYYFIEKLKYGCAALNEQIYYKREYELNLMGPILEVIRIGIANAEPLTKAYYFAFQMLSLMVTNQTEAALDPYDKLKNILIGEHGIEETDLSDLFTYLLNFAGTMEQRDGKTFVEETHLLYKHLLADARIAGFIGFSSRFLKNIIAVRCRSGMIEEAEAFLAESGALEQGNPYFYNKAVIAFHKGEFKLANVYLGQIDGRFQEVMYEVGVRVYRCKITYEMAESERDLEVLRNHLDAFSQFIKDNHKWSLERKQKYKRFIRYLRKLLRIKSKPSIRLPDLEKFKVQVIKETRAHIYFQWIIKKINQQLEV